MPTYDTQKIRTQLAFALIAFAGGAAVALGADAVRTADARKAAAARRSLGVMTIDLGHFRYEFHAPSGRERLFDLRHDPRCTKDVASSHPDRLGRCRSELLASLGVESLDDLRAPYAETIRRLESMGYF